MGAQYRIGVSLLHFLGATSVAGLLLIAISLHSIWLSLPDVSNPRILQAKQSIVIHDREGGELFRFFEDEDRTFVPIEEIPQHMIDAIIAIEDKRFYDRLCIDVRALSRAVVANMFEYKSQGASTISQQLARTAFLSRTKSLERKVREVLLACKLETHYSKDEIAELYLNWISFGHGIAGIQQASKRYFGVNASELSLEQSAVLAALPQRPSYFSPYGPHRRTSVSKELAHAIRSGEFKGDTIPPKHIVTGLMGTNIWTGNTKHYLSGRANVVLKALFDQKRITEPQYISATQNLLTLNVQPRAVPLVAPHFVMTTKQEIDHFIANHPNLSTHEGIAVLTTIDPTLQKTAETIAEKSSVWLADEFQTNNLSMIAIDTRSNEILAYVGNADFFEETGGQIDMVRIPRQTGSSFKPVVYAALLEQGYTDSSRIDDKPINPQIYRPHKSGYYGRMTVRTALARSRNIPAIRAFYLAGGEDAILQFARRLGISTPLWHKTRMLHAGSAFAYSWTLALGAAESSLLEMVQAYSVIANEGRLLPISAVSALTNSYGHILFTPQRQSAQVLSQDTANMLTSILQDEDAREPLWRSTMNIAGHSAALKTGTSTLCMERDAYGSCKQPVPNNTWTIGFSGNILIGVWVGNVDNAPMSHNAAAVETALPIWKELMQHALLHSS